MVTKVNIAGAKVKLRIPNSINHHLYGSFVRTLATLLEILLALVQIYVRQTAHQVMQEVLAVITMISAMQCLDLATTKK